MLYRKFLGYYTYISYCFSLIITLNTRPSILSTQRWRGEKSSVTEKILQPQHLLPPLPSSGIYLDTPLTEPGRDRRSKLVQAHFFFIFFIFFFALHYILPIIQNLISNHCIFPIIQNLIQNHCIFPIVQNHCIFPIIQTGSKPLYIINNPKPNPRLLYNPNNPKPLYSPNNSTSNPKLLYSPNNPKPLYIPNNLKPLSIPSIIQNLIQNDCVLSII